MNNKKLDPKKVSEKAGRILSPKPQGYWIAYRVDRDPIVNSTCHCIDYSINISRQSQPGDEKNKRLAVAEFKKWKVPELEKDHRGITGITVLKAYTDQDHCKKVVEDLNKKNKIK